jgi:hypothetical protein
MHEDQRPMGVLHALTEGVPAAFRLLKDKIKGVRRGRVQVTKRLSPADQKVGTITR